MPIGDSILTHSICKGPKAGTNEQRGEGHSVPQVPKCDPRGDEFVGTLSNECLQCLSPDLCTAAMNHKSQHLILPAEGIHWLHSHRANVSEFLKDCRGLCKLSRICLIGGGQILSWKQLDRKLNMKTLSWAHLSFIYKELDLVINSVVLRLELPLKKRRWGSSHGVS